jgi:uncharacterized membrane protein YgcG
MGVKELSMKKVYLIVALSLLGISLISYADPEKKEEKRVDDLISLIAQQTAEKLTAPLHELERDLESSWCTG